MGEKQSNTKYALEEVKRLLGEKITVINEFVIDTEKLTNTSTKEKIVQPPGIDVAENV